MQPQRARRLPGVLRGVAPAAFAAPFQSTRPLLPESHDTCSVVSPMPTASPMIARSLFAASSARLFAARSSVFASTSMRASAYASGVHGSVGPVSRGCSRVIRSRERVVPVIGGGTPGITYVDQNCSAASTSISINASSRVTRNVLNSSRPNSAATSTSGKSATYICHWH